MTDKADLINQTTLEHYGIKGMKWGVRRDQRTLDRLAGRKVRGGIRNTDTSKRGSSSSTSSSGRKTRGGFRNTDVGKSRKESQDSKTTRKLRNKSLSEMSNQELKQLLDRMDLEKRYDKLTAPQKSAATKFVQDQLRNIANQQIGNWVNKGVNAGVKWAVDEAMKKIKS